MSGQDWIQEAIDAIGKVSAPVRVRHASWKRSARQTESEGLCAYCDRPLDPRSTVINFIVPPALGGPLIHENQLASCCACARSKAHKDLASWIRGRQLDPVVRTALRARRLELLAKSDNHLAHTRFGASRDKIEADLYSRWKHPRFTVYAFHGIEHSVVGWTHRSGCEESLNLAACALRFDAQAEPLPTDKVVLFEVPGNRFLDIVWSLIEHHGIVRQLPLATLDPVPLDPDNWEHFWPVILNHMSHQARRLAQPLTQDPAPRKPRKLSDHPKAAEKRKQRKRKSAIESRQAWLEARASLDRFKDRVAQGLAPAPTPHALAVMEREVLDLLPTR